MLVELHQCGADRTKSTDFLTICRSRSRGRIIARRWFLIQHSRNPGACWNFKVGDQLPRRVPKCLGRSSFGHTFRDFEISLVQLAEDGVDAFLQTMDSSAGGGSPDAVRFLYPLKSVYRD